eukprot:scaffold2257_cov56-Attheya_sp.AAC.4
MFHKDAEGNVVGKDLGVSVVGAVVGGAGIEFGHEEAGFTLVLVADNVTGHGEAAVHNGLRVGLWSFQQGSKGCMFLLFVISLFPPSRNRLPMKDHHMKKGIQQQNRRLHHDQTIGRILTVQNVAIIGSLIGTGVKELQKLGPTKVKHELGIETEFRAEPERGGVVWTVVGKLGTEANETPVDPT